MRKLDVTSGNTSTRVTRQMKIDGPRRAVFATAELLENIIINLSPKQIFAVQRVSRQFHDLVRTSAKAQEKMFLQIPSVPLKTWQLRNSHYVLLTERLKDVSALGLEPDYTDDLMDLSIQNFRPAQLGPMLCKRGSSASSAIRNQYGSGETVSFDFDNTHLDSLASSSCSGLQISNPACISADMHLMWRFSGKARSRFYCSFWRRIGDRRGLTMSNLLNNAMAQKGDIAVRDIEAGHRTKSDVVPIEEIKAFEERCGCKAILDTRESWVTLRGIVIPSEEEWESVHG